MEVIKLLLYSPASQWQHFRKIGLLLAAEHVQNNAEESLFSLISLECDCL